MAHQSNRNLKQRVSRLSRRINKTSRDLAGLAREVGQALQQHQLQTMSTLGLTDVLVQVLEKTQPGLTDAIKAAIQERQEKAQAAKTSNAAAKAAEAGNVQETVT